MKDDLLALGYLPENLPPSFGTQGVAEYFAKIKNNRFLSTGKIPVKAAHYNASKRGMTRRAFSIVHPITAHDTAKFVTDNWKEIYQFFDEAPFSLSVPKEATEKIRALEITSHKELEFKVFEKLAKYKFIACTDISRFYHSIYTHSIPWAVHGKKNSKNDKNSGSKDKFLNRADQILRFGQDGQTIGIPVGPDTSRIFAEIISTGIDILFRDRIGDLKCEVIRHVDDIWIGVDSFEGAEEALSIYRGAIREFELDINENKTRIKSTDFSFCELWPEEIRRRLDLAFSAPKSQRSERYRAAFEYALNVVRSESDDAALKFVIRHIDLSLSHWTNDWSMIEPFLMRCAVQYGHTIDYIVRVLVWRELVGGDFSREAWSKILTNILFHHSRLGNDSEVCWAIYACIRLKIKLDERIAAPVFRNCGALSVISILNCVEIGLISDGIFKEGIKLLQTEHGRDEMWPLLMEWLVRKWPRYRTLSVEVDVIEKISDANVSLFDSERLPLAFRDIDASDFPNVPHAIEKGISSYEVSDEAEALFGAENSVDEEFPF